MTWGAAPCVAGGLTCMPSGPAMMTSSVRPTVMTVIRIRSDGQRHLRLTEQHADDDVAEGACYQQQVEEDEDQQDRPGPWRDQAVRDGREAVTVVAHRDHDRAVVAHPADERHP